MDETDILPHVWRLDDQTGTGLFRDLDTVYLRASMETPGGRMANTGLV